MKRMLRHFLTHDTSVSRSRFYGDEVLNAISPGRVLCLGTTWRGELAPLVEAKAQALLSAYCAPGLSLGRTLSAERVPAALDMGRMWVGGMYNKVLTSIDTGTGPEPRVDVSEVLSALERLRREMGTANPKAISDGCARLRAAAQRVTDSLKGRTTDSRDVLAGINQANRESAARRAAPQLDGAGRMVWRPGEGGAAAAEKTRTSAVRDAAQAAATAATMRDRIGGLNRAAKAFWAGR